MPPETATQLFQAATHRGSGTQPAVAEERYRDDPACEAYVVGPSFGSLGAWSGTLSLDASMLIAAGVGADERLAVPRAFLLPVHAARHCLVSSRKVRSQGFDRSQLIAHLTSALEEAPVESGVMHAGESLLAGTFEANAPEARDLLIRWYRALEDQQRAQALLLLSRTAHPVAAAMVSELSHDALSSPDLELREAGIHALEAAGGPEALYLLRRHTEPDPVLAEYVQRVIQDLGG